VVTLTGAPTNIISDLTVGGFRSTLGTPGTAWDAVSIVEGAVTLIDAPAGNLAVKAAGLDPDYTSIRYARVSGAGQPSFSLNNSLSFNDGDYLYVEVSAPGMPQKFYKIRVNYRSANANVTGITFDGTALNPLPTPGDTWEGATAAVHVVVPASLGTPVSIGVTGAHPDAVLSYTASSNGSATWVSNSQVTVASGDYLGVRVVSPSETVTRYYKFRVSYGSSNATISGVTIAGVESDRLGTPGDAYAASIVSGNIYLTTEQAGGGRTIVVTSSDDVSVRVGTVISSYEAWFGPSNYVSLNGGSGTFTGTVPLAADFFGNPAPFDSAIRVAIEVTAEDNITVKFYRFVVIVE
jgi:hypothetical protein